MSGSNASPRSANRTVTGNGMADMWENSIARLISAPDTHLAYSDTAGDFLDWNDVTLVCRHPKSQAPISDKYEFPQLVDDYVGHFNRNIRLGDDLVKITDRMYEWPLADGGSLDQVATVVSRLADDPESRRGLISVCDPTHDLQEGKSPVGHCLFNFAIRDRSLNLTVVSRSVDAWVGALPNAIAFVGLLETVADQLNVPVGSYHQFILSYHLYVNALPAARSWAQ